MVQNAGFNRVSGFRNDDVAIGLLRGQGMSGFERFAGDKLGGTNFPFGDFMDVPFSGLIMMQIPRKSAKSVVYHVDRLLGAPDVYDAVLAVKIIAEK